MYSYMKAYVTKDQKVFTDAKFLYEGIISIFGALEKIITDQGKAFTSDVVTKSCNQFRVGKTTMMPYQPQGNGQVERAHQTLGNMIEKLENEHKKQWPRHLTKLTHVYNLTRSEITGYLPHFLMFGQRPRLLIDFLFPTNEVMGRVKPIWDLDTLLGSHSEQVPHPNFSCNHLLEALQLLCHKPQPSG